VQLVYVCPSCPTLVYSPLQIVAFLVGYFAQDIRMTLYVGLVGAALTFLVVVPPWPFYNKNPEGWLPATNAKQSFNIDVDGQKVS
jgi:signal peptidase complex subunit 1